MSQVPSDLYQPGTPFDQIGSSQFLQEQLRQRMQANAQLNQMQANDKLNVVKFAQSPLGVSIVVFFLVLLLLYLINPPFIQAPKDSPLEEGSPSLLKSSITALIFALLVYILPLIYRSLVSK